MPNAPSLDMRSAYYDYDQVLHNKNEATRIERFRCSKPLGVIRHYLSIAGTPAHFGQWLLDSEPKEL